MPDDSRYQTGASFATTQWNLVIAAAQSQTPGAHDAFSQLCKNYWMPLYAFARRQGAPPHEARDLVQGFFKSLLTTRTYANAQKRGGGLTPIPFDETLVETRLAADNATLTHEKAFDRQWACTVIDQAFASLRAEFAAEKNETVFDILAPFLTGDDSQSYDQADKALALPTATFKTQLHRLRVKFRAHLRRHVACTVAPPP